MKAAAIAASALAAALAAGVAPAAAADAAAGRQKAQMCAACHGPMGIALTPDAANLAGQNELYIANQLRAFRSAARQHEIMSLIAKPLTDVEIANLAAWYASIMIEVKEPQK